MHVHVANSLAMELAGIDENFVPPTPNSVEYDENHKPNGILRESAVTPVLRTIPDMLPTYEDKKDGIADACADMNRYGITGIHPIQGKFVDADEYLNIYQDLEKENRLPVRVYISFDEYPSFHMKTGFGNEKIRYGFYKIYSDGSLGSRNAALTEPYSDKPDTCGLLNHSPEEIKEMFHQAYDQDLQIGIHAIGDKGVEIALDAMEECFFENPKPDVRFRLIHAIVLRKDLIERMKKLPIVVDIQPRFMSNYNIWWSEDRLGPERVKYAYAWNTLIKEGMILTGSSDAPVEPYSPMLGVYSIVCRQDLTGKPEGGWYPDERVSVYDALCMYTKNAAYSSYEEDIKGTKSSDRYGLIHSDLNINNILVDGDVVNVLDFDDCGYGWFLYDLATSVLEYDDTLEEMIAAWVEGYEQIRTLSEADKKEIDTFVVLRKIVRIGWIYSHIDNDTVKRVTPKYYEETTKLASKYIEKYGN